MSNDPTIPEVNIGLVGHVDHGKTTLTNALSGKWTDTHSEELKRGITIRIGYADIQVRRTQDGSYTVDETDANGGDTELVRSISLVDAPGHETLMANVLSGAAIMDGALLLVAANEEVPQPQTREHLAAMDKSGIENIVVVQNKIDLVDEEEAMANYQQIRDFLQGSVAEDAPIVPISAQHNVNIDMLLQTIQETIPTPERDAEAAPKMLAARSFDVNRPGTPATELRGGVIGGSLQRGTIRVGDELELRPGYQRNGKWKTITTTVKSIIQGNQTVEEGHPGGLLGIETDLDPSLAKSDNLAGNIIGDPEHMPPIRDELIIEVDLMAEAVGSDGAESIDPIKENEPLLLTVGTGKTSGMVTEAGTTIKTDLKLPVCAEEGDRVAISRRFGSRWRLIGGGIVRDTK